MKTKRRTATIDPALHKKLKDVSKRQGRYLEFLIDLALTDFLEQEARNRQSIIARSGNEE